MVNFGMISIRAATSVEAVKADVQASRVVLQQVLSNGPSFGKYIVWTNDGVETLGAILAVDRLCWCWYAQL